MTTRTFTAEQLAEYNGQNGKSAYIAVEGVVYDVSDVPAWHNGRHHGNLAGHDVSAAIKRSLHMEKVLDELPVVGKFTGEQEI